MTKDKAKQMAKKILYRPLGNSLDPNWWDETQRLIANALTLCDQEARKEQVEKDAKIADEHARKMNVLGSDKDMVRKMTHAMIQAERVYEAQDIATAIRSQSIQETK